MKLLVLFSLFIFLTAYADGSRSAEPSPNGLHTGQDGKPAAHEPTDLTYETLLKLITDKDIRTAQALVTNLPPHYYEEDKHALAFETASAHAATGEKPRTIYFGKKARTLIAISGGSDPNQIAHVEVLHTVNNGKTWEAREITFDPEGKKKPDISIANPPATEYRASCFSCHHGKPNWDHYQAWPGFFGSAPTGFTPRRELEAWALFSKSYKSDPRYAKLKIRADPNLDTSVGQLFHASLHEGPDNVTQKLSVLNARRIAHLIHDSVAAEPYAIAVLGAVIGCPNVGDFFPQPEGAAVRKLRERFKRFYDAKALEDIHHKSERQMGNERYTGEGAIGDIPGVYINTTGTRETADQLASLAAILRPLNVEMRYWSLSFHEPSTSFNDGLGETFFYKTMQYVDYLKQGTFKEVEFEGLMRSLQNEYRLEDYESVINDQAKMLEYAKEKKIKITPTNSYRDYKVFLPAQCAYLAEKSLARIKKLAFAGTAPWIKEPAKHLPELSEHGH